MARWYVMRDLKRANAKERAYDVLADAGFEAFTPQRWEVVTRGGRKERVLKAVIPDLLFVHADKPRLDEELKRIPSLQYRYQRGHKIDDPMTVGDAEMERFIRALEATREDSEAKFFKPEEMTAEMVGKEVRIIGGELNGYTGKLLKMRGSKRRWLLVELPGLLSAAVEVQPEYVELI